MSIFRKLRHIPAPLVWFAALIHKGMCATLRVTINDPHGVLDDDELYPAIFIFWHNRLLALSPTLPLRRRSGMAFLASRSRDGNYIASFLRWFDAIAVRGSSSRGAGAALRALVEKIEAGHSLAVTPDGPRGPRYTIGQGAIWLAAKTGRPLILMSLNTERHFELSGWDRMQIPKPFSRAELVFGDPIHVPADTDKAGRKELQVRLRQSLMAITRCDHGETPDEDTAADG